MEIDRERTTAREPDPAQAERMVAVFSSSNRDGELESLAVKGVLEASGIPAIQVGAHVLPNLEFQVQVPASMEAEARQVLRDARQGGRRAADEAERATEITKDAGK